MPLIDVRTLLLVITIALICRAAVLAYVWHIARHYPPIRFWTLGSVLVAIGALLVGLRDIITPVVSILLAQTLIVSGWMLIVGGIGVAAGRRTPWHAGAVLTGLCVVGVAWYTLANPDFVARTVLLTVAGLAFDLYAAWACFRSPAGRRGTTLRILGGLLLLQAVANGWKMQRIVADGIDTLTAAGAATTPYYLITLIVILVGTVLFVLLAAQTLQEQLDDEITERIAREKSLKLASLVYEHSSEGMVLTDTDGTIITVNPAFTALTGYRADEVIGKTPRILKSGRHDEAFYADLWRNLMDKGAWQGELWNRHKNGELRAERLTINTIYDRDGSAAQRVALFHDVTAQKQTAELIFRQAHFDALTGLPNRYFFFEQLSKELSRARRSDTRVALISMDLNKFKPVNDRYGHEAGDFVLKAVCERWSAVVRTTDTLVRLGGDEFALIVGGLPAAEDARLVAQKLIDALADPIMLPGGQRCPIGTSVGIALFPDNAMEMDSLIAAADDAMYASKAQGGNHLAFSALRADEANAGGDWVAFDNSHLVGIAVIDEQHRRLVRLVNEVNRELKGDSSEAVLKQRFSQLMEFTAIHFDTEEALMERHGYPERAAHAQQHQALKSQLDLIARDFTAGDELRVLQSIKDWLMGHIRHADKPLGAWLAGRGEE